MSDNEIRTAMNLALNAHRGQQDKSGRDYFDAHLVPIATAASRFGPTVECAAWLHDILEDTDTTTDDLARAGITPAVIAAVESVTRQPDETYQDLITRACADPVGRYVKLVDNAWNITSNPVLARTDPKRAASLLKGRYEPARQRLLAACDLDLDSPGVRDMQAVLDALDVHVINPAPGQSRADDGQASAQASLSQSPDRP